jgi:hypothetical protein
MRSLKISLLVLMLSATLYAQQDNFLHSEKSLLTPFIIQTNDNPAQKLRQELNQIINQLNNTDFYLNTTLKAG